MLAKDLDRDLPVFIFSLEENDGTKVAVLGGRNSLEPARSMIAAETVSCHEGCSARWMGSLIMFSFLSSVALTENRTFEPLLASSLGVAVSSSMPDGSSLERVSKVSVVRRYAPHP